SPTLEKSSFVASEPGLLLPPVRFSPSRRYRELQHQSLSTPSQSTGQVDLRPRTKEHPMANGHTDVEHNTNHQVRPWTVMVYMQASNSEDLDGYAVKNLLEMEKGVNEHSWVVVQIKRPWPAAPQKYVISRDRKSANDDKPAKVDSIGPSKFTDMG